MTCKLWFRLTTSLLVALCLSLSAEEKKEKERDVKKKAGEAAEPAVKAKERAEVVEEKEAKAEKPVANPEDVNNFRKRRDPAAVEIVTLYDEIDKAYTEMRTAMNVAAGDDKEARKAKTEVKALQSKTRRQVKKLEDAVGKLTLPLERDYKTTKRAYDALQEKAKEAEEKKQEKKATGLYQQADRYTGQMEAAKRTLDTARSFLYFESAEGLDLGGDEADGGKSARTEKGDKPRNGNRANKGDKNRE